MRKIENDTETTLKLPIMSKEISKMLKKILNTLIVVFSVVPAVSNLDIYSGVILMLSLIFMLLNEEIISFIVFIFAFLYIVTFSNASLNFALAFVLLYLFKSQKINRLFATASYFGVISVLSSLNDSSNYFTPVLAISFLIVNYIEELFDEKIYIPFFIVLVILILPLPEFSPGLSLFKLLKSTTQEVSSGVQEKVEEPLQNIKTYAFEKSKLNDEKNIKENTQKNKNFNTLITFIEDLNKINQGIMLLMLLIIAISVIVSFKRFTNGKEKIKRIEFKRMMLLILAAILFTLTVSQFGIRYLSSKTQKDFAEKKQSQLFSNELENNKEQVVVEKVETMEKADKTESNNHGILSDYAVLLLQISSVLLNISLITAFIASVKQSIAHNTTMEKSSNGILAMQFKTDYPYEKILTLNGKEFIDHSYRFIRQTFYPEYDNLTPYELLELEKGKSKSSHFDELIENLKILTEEFVNLKYALREIDDRKDLFEAVKDSFFKFCKIKDSTSFIKVSNTY